jgi:hypothetical protein
MPAACAFPPISSRSLFKEVRIYPVIVLLLNDLLDSNVPDESRKISVEGPTFGER